MTDPISKPKPFGDAALAEKVIAAYAEGLDGLKADEMSELGIAGQKSRALANVMNGVVKWDKVGVLTPWVKKALEDSGFSKSFVNALAGPDGTRALHERVKWLADHAVKRWYRVDLEDYERLNALEGLKNFGQEAKGAIPFLLELLNEGELGWKAAQAFAAIIPDPSTRVEVLKKAGLADLSQLMMELKDPSPDVRIRALHLLGLMGPSAAPAVSKMIPLVRERDMTVIDAFRAIGPSAKEAIPALLKKYEDVQQSTSSEEEKFLVSEAIIGALVKIGIPDPGVLELMEKNFGKRGRYSSLPVVFSPFGKAALPTICRLLAVEQQPSMLIADLLANLKFIQPAGKDIRPLVSAMAKGKSMPFIRMKDFVSVFDHLEDTFPKEIVFLLQDTDPNIRIVATASLPHLPMDSVSKVFHLAGPLNDSEDFVRIQAARVLAEMGQAAILALPLLIHMQLYDHDELCRIEAGKAIQAIEEKVL